MLRKLRKFQDFRASENGAITVDWVVLTALIVSLIGLLITTLYNGNSSVATALADHLSAIAVSQ